MGSVGVPVKVGEASKANPEIDAPDGMVSVPVKVGEASGAFKAKAAKAKAVVAILVVLSPAL